LHLRYIRTKRLKDSN